MLEKKYWIAVVCKLCLITTSFLVTIFLNRGLGVDGKGDYAYIINFVEMLYIIFSVGLGQCYSTFKRSVGGEIKNIFVVLAFIHGIAVLVLGHTLIRIKNLQFGGVIVTLTALAVVKVIISMIAVTEESIRRNIIQSVINLVYVLCLAGLFLADRINLTMVLICYACNDIFTIAFLMKIYHLKPAYRMIRFKLIKRLYSVGIITMIVMLLISINYSVDTIMLKKMSASYYVGLYSVGVNFSNMFLLIPDSFKEVLFGDSTRNNFSKRIAINAIKVSLMTSVICLFCFVFLGRFVIKIFYGVEYIPAYYITLILFIGSLSMIFFKILQPIYISHGNQKKAVFFLSCSAIANIALNLFLIPRLNAIGASIASAVSYTICGMLFFLDYVKNKD